MSAGKVQKHSRLESLNNQHQLGWADEQTDLMLQFVTGSMLEGRMSCRCAWEEELASIAKRLTKKTSTQYTAGQITGKLEQMCVQYDAFKVFLDNNPTVEYEFITNKVHVSDKYFAQFSKGQEEHSLWEWYRAVGFPFYYDCYLLFDQRKGNCYVPCMRDSVIKPLLPKPLSPFFYSNKSQKLVRRYP